MKMRTSGENLRDSLLLNRKQLVGFFFLICSEMFSGHENMSRIWRKQEVCDLASPCKCGHESVIYEIIHKINRRWKSDICSINTERRRAVGTCDGGVLTCHSAENWKNMTAWHDPASLTHCCLFSTALATRSVWLEQISSLTPAFWTTHLFCLRQSQPGELAADTGPFFSF